MDYIPLGVSPQVISANAIMCTCITWGQPIVGEALFCSVIKVDDSI